MIDYEDIGIFILFHALTGYCRELGVPLHIEHTKIGPIVFDTRQESNPCSLLCMSFESRIKTFNGLSE
ncbi:MAG: hypothetical protein WC834_04895 [Eubacteriales bacterium]